MGLKDGDMVEVCSGSYSARIKVELTEFVHPGAAFLVHGFGHRLPTESRAYDKGIHDNDLMGGGLDILDPAGGGLAMQEHFITVRKVSRR